MRGFTNGAVRADRGAVVRTEFAPAFSIASLIERRKDEWVFAHEVLQGLQPYVFADYGVGRDIPNHETLERAGIGAGLRYRHGRVNLDASIGEPVYRTGGPKTNKWQAPEAYLMVTLDAKRDVIVGTGMDANGSTSSRKEKGLGLTWSGGQGGFSVGAGYHASSQYSAYDKVSVAQSIIKGGKGVSIKAGDDITMVAASVVSKKHVSLNAGDDIKLLAGLNRESSYQSSKAIFAGITLKVSQNVTGAAQQLRQSASTFSSGYGGAGYRVLGQVSGALQATDALKSLTNPSVSASLMLGASGSSASSRAAAYDAVPTVIRAGSLGLRAGGDAHLVGTQVSVRKDILIDVKGDLKVESAQSYAEAWSKANSWNAGVGLSFNLSPTSGLSSGITVEGGFSKDKSRNWSETQINAHLDAGGTITIKTGRDATFAGAGGRAKDIDLDIGRNLTVASRQDTAHSSSSSVNGSGSVTIGIGASPSSASVSFGGGRGSSDVAWVSEQSGFFATDKLTVRVEKHTQLDGAVLNSDKDKLTLDTGTLGYSDIKDHDKGSSISGQVGVTVGSGGPSVNVSGSYASHDIEQETRATIGEGEVVIRDKDKQKQDVAAINRDVDQAQVITKIERAGVQVYASDASVRAAVNAVEIVGKTLSQASTSVFSELGRKGNKTFQDLAEAKEQGKLTDEDIISQLSNCKSHAFNLFDIFISPAHASAACGVKTSDGRYISFTLTDKERCVDTYVQILGKSLEYQLNSLDNSELVCLDCGPGGTRVTYPAFSGQGDATNDPGKVNVPFVGAVPPGAYYLVARESGGTLGWLRDAFRSVTGNDKSNWFTLVSADTLSGKVTVGGVTRDNIRLHPGTISEGCVTLCYTADFDQLRQQLLGGQLNYAPGSDKRVFGTIIVYPGKKPGN